MAGRARGFYYDIRDGADPPEPGDVLVAPRNAYLVRAIRPVDSRVWHDRWHVEVLPLGPKDGRDARTQIARAPRLHGFYWYRPGERPGDRR